MPLKCFLLVIITHHATFLINRRLRQAFRCAFPAFLLPMAQKLRIRSKWIPWSAGCGTWSSEWCFARCLQFGRNLEELARGVCPSHADILVLEHEEIAIPRPGLFLPCTAQVQLGQCLLIGSIIALGLDDDYLIRLRRKKKRSFPFTPLGKLRKLGNVTLSVVDF